MFSKRKQAEKKFNGLLEATPDGIVVVDQDGRIVLINKNAEKLFGYSREELIGQLVEILVPDSVRDRHQEYRQSYMAQPRVRILGQPGLTLTAQRSDGVEFPVEIGLSPLLIKNEILIIAAVRDITERKKAEEAKRQLEEQLNRAQKLESLGKMAGAIAHDFTNMLTVVVGYSKDLLKKLSPEDPTLESIREIHKAAQNAVAFTNELLAFSRKQTIKPEVLDMNTKITGMEAMLQRIIGSPVRLKTVLKPSLWPVQADPGQIEQILMNLVLNARDAMPKGGTIVLLTDNINLDESYAQSHFEAKPGPHVMLSVSDNGVGMDLATRARIFEPFFTTKKEGKGTGLGLATVYGIVKQNGGHIYVDSAPDQGSTFKIFFPRHLS